MRFWEQRRPPPRFRSTARFWEQQIALSLKHAFSGLARLAAKRVFSRISQKGAFFFQRRCSQKGTFFGKPRKVLFPEKRTPPSLGGAWPKKVALCPVVPKNAPFTRLAPKTQFLNPKNTPRCAYNGQVGNLVSSHSR